MGVKLVFYSIWHRGCMALMEVQTYGHVSIIQQWLCYILTQAHLHMHMHLEREALDQNTCAHMHPWSHVRGYIDAHVCTYIESVTRGSRMSYIALGVPVYNSGLSVSSQNISSNWPHPLYSLQLQFLHKVSWKVAFWWAR